MFNSPLGPYVLSGVALGVLMDSHQKNQVVDKYGDEMESVSKLVKNCECSCSSLYPWEKTPLQL